MSRLNRTTATHLLLAALVLAVYGQTVMFDFVDYDDPGYLLNLKRIAHGLTLENVWWSFTTLTKANYHPLTWLSYMADVSLFGLIPAGFHFTNIILHLANTLLLFELLSRMTGDRMRSFLVAALFGVHPLHAESVAWISERKDVLSTLFALAAIGVYVHWVRQPRRSTWCWLLALMLLSLLAKQTMVTLPCVLILLDIWPLGRIKFGGSSAVPQGENELQQVRNFGETTLRVVRERLAAIRQRLGMHVIEQSLMPATKTTAAASGAITLWQSIREKWSLFLLSIVFCISVVNAQKLAGAMVSINHLSPAIRIGNATLSYAIYLRKVFWPMDLAFFYPHPREDLDWGQVTAAVVVLSMITIACWIVRRRNPSALVGWLWYLGTLFPMIGIVQVGAQGLADRYMYVPLIGIGIILAWCIPDSWLMQRRSRWMVQIGCGVLLILLTIQGWRQAATWRNTYTMANHALRLNPKNDVAWSQLGYRLLEDGRVEVAEACFHEAITLNPKNRVECYYNLGYIREKRGDFEEAFEWYRRSMQRNEKYLPARRGLGAALLGLNRLEEAGREINAGLELFPRSAGLWHLKGRWHARLGELDEARTALYKALEIDPERDEAIEELKRLGMDLPAT